MIINKFKLEDPSPEFLQELESFIKEHPDFIELNIKANEILEQLNKEAHE